MVIRVAGRQIVADPRPVLRAVRIEAMSTPRILKAWFGLLGVFILLGAVAAIRALIPGDKGLGTTPTFEWGLLIVGYVFFAVTTSGLCLASSLGTVFGIDRFRPLEKRHAVLAVLCLVTAFGIIVLDLHFPVRMVLGAVFNPSPSSPMWWMGVVYGIYLCFLLTEVWSMFRGRPRLHATACLLSSVMAIIAPTTLGAVFGVLASRPYWTGVITPLLMVATALLSGTALLGIVFYAVDRWRLTGFERAGRLAIPAIRSLLTVALVTVTCLVGWQVIVGLLSPEPGASSAIRALVSGPLAVQFVGIRVVAGLVIPLVVLALPIGRTARGVLWASGLSFVGVFADRLAFVSAGQIAPTTTVSGVVSAPYAGYTPTLVEIGILVGAAAFVGVVYTLAERYLDLRESEVHLGLLLPRGWGRRLRARVGPDVAGAPEGPALALELVEPEAEAGSETRAADREPPAGSREPGGAEPEPQAGVFEAGTVAPEVTGFEREAVALAADGGSLAEEATRLPETAEREPPASESTSEPASPATESPLGTAEPTPQAAESSLETPDPPPDEAPAAGAPSRSRLARDER